MTCNKHPATLYIRPAFLFLKSAEAEISVANQPPSSKPDPLASLLLPPFLLSSHPNDHELTFQRENPLLHTSPLSQALADLFRTSILQPPIFFIVLREVSFSNDELFLRPPSPFDGTSS